MLQLKVTTVGNSTGIVLPKEALARLKVKKGDSVFLVETSTGYELTPFDPEFGTQMELAEKGMRDYRNALRELSNK
jgi:putative addiction module antidote